MAIKIEKPTIIKSAGNMPKKIEEFIGRVNSGTDELSLARMKSPAGWIEPAQTPDFNEYTVVLKGMLKVETEQSNFEVRAGEAFIAYAGERIQYSTPGPDGAEYIAVCCPAFSNEAVHREK